MTPRRLPVIAEHGSTRFPRRDHHRALPDRRRLPRAPSTSTAACAVSIPVAAGDPEADAGDPPRSAGQARTPGAEAFLDGDLVTLDLPGVNAAEANALAQAGGSGSELEFKAVVEGSEAMRKLADHPRRRAPRRRDRPTPTTVERGRARADVTCARPRRAGWLAGGADPGPDRRRPPDPPRGEATGWRRRAGLPHLLRRAPGGPGLAIDRVGRRPGRQVLESAGGDGRVRRGRRQALRRRHRGDARPQAGHRRRRAGRHRRR